MPLVAPERATLTLTIEYAPSRIEQAEITDALNETLGVIMVEHDFLEGSDEPFVLGDFDWRYSEKAVQQ